MISTKEWTAPKDYKVYCFHGIPKYILVCVGRENNNEPKFYFMDCDWKLARINKDSIDASENFYIEKPVCLMKMLDYAKKLSEPFPFVRVDFYISNDELFFGEMTFTPAAGFDTNRLPETDKMLGELLCLE